MAGWYRKLHRYSQAFALVADWTTVVLGGALKRSRRSRDRMADLLSDLYLMSATLKRFDEEGRLSEDKEWSTHHGDRIAQIERNFGAVFANFPNPVFAWAMRILLPARSPCPPPPASDA